MGSNCSQLIDSIVNQENSIKNNIEDIKIRHKMRCDLCVVQIQCDFNTFLRQCYNELMSSPSKKYMSFRVTMLIQSLLSEKNNGMNTQRLIMNHYLTSSQQMKDLWKRFDLFDIRNSSETVHLNSFILKNEIKFLHATFQPSQNSSKYKGCLGLQNLTSQNIIFQIQEGQVFICSQNKRKNIYVKSFQQTLSSGQKTCLPIDGFSFEDNEISSNKFMRYQSNHINSCIYQMTCFKIKCNLEIPIPTNRNQNSSGKKSLFYS